MKRSEKITNKQLTYIGYYELDLIKAAGKTAKKLGNRGKYSKEVLLEVLKEVLENPSNYLADPDFMILAEKVQLLREKNEEQRKSKQPFELKPEVPPYEIFGTENIEEGAKKQMDVAMKLPISVAGALMPDAHQGYGLPIGGVLATQADKVIPYAVGVDIACRMCMSVFEIEAAYLDNHTNKFKNLLHQNTCFGTGKGFDKPLQDDLFDKDTWNATKVIRDLKKKAIQQIGSSGTGNHFVEWGHLEITSEPNEFGLPKGTYLALLSHSGSRGFGATIAGHYSKLAMQKTKLPDVAKHLAWLDMNTQEGQEYWIGMNLAGEYASANHHHIHQKMATALNTKPVKMIENHHNFAWKETLKDGTEVIVHRKGATPANEKEWGIIPGSMTKPGYVIKGKGNPDAVFSASHGAGRLMSRAKAKKTITEEAWRRELTENGVTLIGGDLDEAPMAYKDIDQVMEYQSDLVEVLARFVPKVVRMADKEDFGRRMKRKNTKEVSFKET